MPARPLHLTLLLLGLAVGMLLNPHGLSRFFPDAYERCLLGSDPDIGRQITDLQHEAQANLARLQSTGVTDAAVTAYQDDIAGKLDALRVRQAVARAQRDRWLATHALAIAGAIILLMGLEAMLIPRRQPRVALLRILLAAALVALPVARLDWLIATPWLVVLTPVAIGLILAALPPRREPAP